MDFSSTSHTATTTLCDLNDDCLLEVFEHLDQWDLCDVGDVCSRFRRIAEISFVCSGYKDLITPPPTSFYRDNDSRDHILLLDVSRLLRRFGRSIHTFRAYPVFRDPQNWFPNYEKRKQKYYRGVFEVLIKYCSGTLNKLTLEDYCYLSDETILEMRPLLEGLEEFHCDEASQCPMLPLWSTELQSFGYSDRYSPQLIGEEKICRFSGFRKLVKICLTDVHDVTNDDVEELLKYNPQLKVIFLVNCQSIEIRSIFEVIAEHGVQVEALKIQAPRGGAYILNTMPFRRFNNLRYLSLSSIHSLESFIWEIATDNSALTNLELAGSVERRDLFIQGILKLKNLKRLYLRLRSIFEWTFIDICSICKQLHNVRLEMKVKLTGEDLLQLIGSAENLKSLTVDKYRFTTYTAAGLPIIVDKHIINVEVFEEMVKLVKNRSKETHLEIGLDRRIYAINVTDELARAHKKTITLGYFKNSEHDSLAFEALDY